MKRRAFAQRPVGEGRTGRLNGQHDCRQDPVATAQAEAAAAASVESNASFGAAPRLSAVGPMGGANKDFSLEVARRSGRSWAQASLQQTADQSCFGGTLPPGCKHRRVSAARRSGRARILSFGRRPADLAAAVCCALIGRVKFAPFSGVKQLVAVLKREIEQPDDLTKFVRSPGINCFLAHRRSQEGRQDMNHDWLTQVIRERSYGCSDSPCRIGRKRTPLARALP